MPYKDYDDMILEKIEKKVLTFLCQSVQVYPSL